jgi:hypothetical protein
VRTPTRTVLTTVAMLIGVAAAAAQAPGPRPAVLITPVRSGEFQGPARTPAAVVERLMSFDANADRRVSRDELPERMQGLVARGDKNADDALDADEIRAIVDTTSAERVRFSFHSQSLEGLPGVISDLRLPQAKHVRALALVSAPTPLCSINVPGSTLLEELKALLDDEEYENFVAAATRLSRSADIRFRAGCGRVVP